MYPDVRSFTRRLSYVRLVDSTTIVDKMELSDAQSRQGTL